MHRLLRKKALDATNEALLGEAQYPGADPTYPLFDAFKGTEPEQIKHAGKRAQIKMHESPKVLPPRTDMRSYVDEDIKQEMEEDLNHGMKEAAVQGLPTTRLTPEQDQQWVEAYEFHKGEGLSDRKASALADEDMIESWPQLARFRHWMSPEAG